MEAILTSILLELSLRDVLSDIPHDAGAFVTLVLVLAFVGFVIHGSRGGTKGGGTAV